MFNDFAVYYNPSASYAKIHKVECNHLRKHGGSLPNSQELYKYFRSLEDAERYVFTLNIRHDMDIYCKTCKPN